MSYQPEKASMDKLAWSGNSDGEVAGDEDFFDWLGLELPRSDTISDQSRDNRPHASSSELRATSEQSGEKEHRLAGETRGSVRKRKAGVQHGALPEQSKRHRSEVNTVDSGTLSLVTSSRHHGATPQLHASSMHRQSMDRESMYPASPNTYREPTLQVNGQSYPEGSRRPYQAAQAYGQHSLFDTQRSSYAQGGQHAIHGNFDRPSQQRRYGYGGHEHQRRSPQQLAPVHNEQYSLAHQMSARGIRQVGQRDGLKHYTERHPFSTLPPVDKGYSNGPVRHSQGPLFGQASGGAPSDLPRVPLYSGYRTSSDGMGSGFRDSDSWANFPQANASSSSISLEQPMSLARLGPLRFPSSDKIIATPDTGRVEAEQNHQESDEAEMSQLFSNNTTQNIILSNLSSDKPLPELRSQLEGTLVEGELDTFLEFIDAIAGLSRPS